MQDLPESVEMIDVVADFIRTKLLPQLEGHSAFHAMVAANALDIVKRELKIAPQANKEEKERLTALLSTEGSLDNLNRTLCEQISSGEMTLDTDGLKDHLWKTTLAKLSIDQPKYSAYRKSLDGMK